VRKKLYAVVLIRIVRRRDNDAGMEIVLPDEAGNAGCGENSSERNGSTSVSEARGDDGGDVRARFAGIGSDERVWRRMIAMEKRGYGNAEGEKSGVIERRSTGDAADAVRSKKLSRHKVSSRQMMTDKKFSTAVRACREARRRMC
jgi:hypothetical protein